MDRTTKACAFKEAFCASFKCPLEKYEREILFRSFFWHALPIALLMFWTKPLSLKLAREAVDQLGRATSQEEVRMIIDDYHYTLWQSHTSALVRQFRIQLSGKRMLKLFNLLQPTISASGK